MEINTQKFALAAAETAAIFYIACAVLVAIAPEFAMKLLGWLAHVTNTEALARSVTMTGVIYGLIQVVIYMYVSVTLFAWLYNRALFIFVGLSCVCYN